MPHRRLVKFGETPKPPTIREFFMEMADRQAKEIKKLKEGLETDSKERPANRITPYPWQLHPMRKEKKKRK